MSTSSLVPEVPTKEAGSTNWGYLGGSNPVQDKLDQEALNAYTDWIAFSAFLYDGVAGSGNLNANYSASPRVFSLFPPADFRIRVNTLRFTIEDEDLQTQGYGGVTPLPVGIKIKVDDSDDNLIIDISETAPIQDLASWLHHGQGVIRLGEKQNDDDLMSGLLSFNFDNDPNAIQLEGNGDFTITLSDDHTRLLGHFMTVTGAFSFDTSVTDISAFPYITGIVGV